MLLAHALAGSLSEDLSCTGSRLSVKGAAATMGQQDRAGLGKTHCEAQRVLPAIVCSSKADAGAENRDSVTHKQTVPA